MNPRNPLVGALIAIAISLPMPLTALAAEVQRGDSVTVGPTQVVTDDLYAFGTNVDIQGTVQGDVIAAGTIVTISGHVTGNVMAAGNNVAVSGPVDGSVRIAGSTVDLAGPVSGDALMAGSTMTVRSTGQVGRDALLAGANMNLQGPVARNVKAGGSRLTIATSVGGGLDANVADLVLADGASIAGPVAYTSANVATVAPTATTGNGIQHFAPVTTSNPWELLGVDVLALVRGFVGMAAFGLLLAFAFPRATAMTSTTLQRRWPASILAGFVFVVAVPVLALVVLLLGVLVGGWWMGIALLALYAIMAPFGYVACAEWLGLTALRNFNRPAHALWAMLVGLLLLGIVSVIPLLGGIILMVAAMFGVGGLVMTAWQTYHAAPVALTPAVAQPMHTPLQVAA